MFFLVLNSCWSQCTAILSLFGKTCSVQEPSTYIIVVGGIMILYDSSLSTVLLNCNFWLTERSIVLFIFMACRGWYTCTYVVFARLGVGWQPCPIFQTRCSRRLIWGWSMVYMKLSTWTVSLPSFLSYGDTLSWFRVYLLSIYFWFVSVPALTTFNPLMATSHRHSHDHHIACRENCQWAILWKLGFLVRSCLYCELAPWLIIT